MNISNYLSYSKLKERYESLDNKKRLIVIIVSMAIIIILWYLLFIMPLQSKSSRVNSQARSDLNNQLKLAQTTIIKLIQATHSPADVEKDEHTLFYDRLADLYAQNKLDTNIDNTIKHLLNDRYGLVLSGFTSKQINAPKEMNTKKVKFKPYEIHLSFNGSFLQLASYLKQFEKPELPLYFKNLFFSVTKYPQGRLTLDILTVVADKKEEQTKETK